MPRKRFEETPYDPIAADLMREVAAAGRVLPTIPVTSPAPVESIALGSRVVSLVPPKSPATTIVPATEPTITKRFVITRTENQDMNEFLLRLEQRAKTKT